MTDLADRYAAWLVGHSRAVVVAAVVLTAVVAAGAAVGDAGSAGIGEFDVDAPETRAGDYVEDRYETDDRIVAQIVVRDDGGDVLTKDSLLDGLYLQADARSTASIDGTLAEPGFQGIENVVATAAVFEDRAAESDGPPETGRPTLDEQIDALESRPADEVEALLTDVLSGESGPDSEGTPAGTDPTAFLPSDYEPGTTDAESRLTLVFQEDAAGEDAEPRTVSEAQVELESLFDERFDDGFVFGQGISDEASSNAVGDSFAIITPVAFVLVLFILGVTYRDVVDVLLGIAGIAVVMAWLAGLMGWLAIPSSQLLIAVPFLLIGLSIDYSLHVVMRYREARAGDSKSVDDEGDADTHAGGEGVGIRTGMAVGLGGVILALAAATFSTGVGFLSNVVSPLPAIRDFAILSAGGIFAALVAFGVLIPALKAEVDGILENRFERNRAKAAFGTTPGPVNRALAAGVALARRAPIAVVIVTVVLASVGAYGATTIDTEFNRTDFLPRDAPDWAKSLPGPLAAGTYTIADDATYLGENFRAGGEGSQAEILIRPDGGDGGVTDPEVLPAIEGARTAGGEWETIDAAPDGTAAVEGPLSVARDLAAANDDVAVALDERETTGDAVPDEDIAGLYDALYGADAERAGTVIERTDGEYESLRLVVSVRGDASAQDVAADVEALADEIEAGADVRATPTGGPVQTAVVQDALLETLVQALAVTLVVILVFLTALYWLRHGAPSLGPITMAPVVIALACLIGMMALLELPFNSETAVITSLAIGLGVDYSIHLGERFVSEKRGFTETSANRAATNGSREKRGFTETSANRAATNGSREKRGSAGTSTKRAANGGAAPVDVENALMATVTGTGGALLGSAATTAAGFGVLALALAPPLRRFGIVTGLAIILAFLSCLLVLPSLLVVRERLLTRFRAE
ncbi:efflux RND transporter permease subunit [Halovivax limisalsi]|uniref:efflux RND transporter permease subunit n=1 Tax=Halovivax limisalsi TaxID=1453760 RepID=UPI001FFC7F9B|nr:MMPL family transporter [Halovivax limisalsi]